MYMCMCRHDRGVKVLKASEALKCCMLNPLIVWQTHAASIARDGLGQRVSKQQISGFSKRPGPHSLGIDLQCALGHRTGRSSGRMPFQQIAASRSTKAT